MIVILSRLEFSTFETEGVYNFTCFTKFKRAMFFVFFVSFKIVKNATKIEGT